MYQPAIEELEPRLAPAVFTVLNTDDSGADSLRQAILAANSMPNQADDVDRIEFNIPGAGVRTIRPASNLPIITDPVVIDGYTQTGTSANTLAAGNDAVLLVELSGGAGATVGLNFGNGAGGSTARGLVVNNFSDLFGAIQLQANGITIEGNFIGTNAAGTADLGNAVGVSVFSSGGHRIGGTAPQARNVISGNTTGILLESTGAGTRVEGNFIGTNASGTGALGNGDAGFVGAGISVGRAAPDIIGGTEPGAGNVISGNAHGIVMQTSGPKTIQGNFIGTDVTGTQPLANAGRGIDWSGNNGGPLIGGTDADDGVVDGIVRARNVISANRRVGISLGSNGARVQGNFIGTNVTGNAGLPNIDGGVSLLGSNNLIGGTDPGAGNLIAFNDGGGVFNFPGTGNRILGNRIHTNAAGMRFGLGIDLNNDGVTANDPDDLDGFGNANNLQNYPVLTSVTPSGTDIMIAGTLNSTPNTTFRIELFASRATDPSSFGEGEFFLGATQATTNGDGDATFTAMVPVPAGEFITATATDLTTNDTSEFSAIFMADLPDITDLAITNTDSQASDIPGTTISYTIVVSNSGAQNAPGSMVTDNFPASLTGVSWTAAFTGGATGNANGNGNLNELVNLPAGSSITYTVNATISPAATGTLTNTATVTAAAGIIDSNGANNTRADDTTLTPQADLSISKTDNQISDMAGTTIAYTIVVSNAGPSDAPGSTVTDNFPAGLTGIAWTAAFTGGATGNAGGNGNISETVNLPAGSSVTFTATATISAGATATLSNTATVTAANGITDAAGNNSATDTTTLAAAGVDLAVTITDSQTTDVPGTAITYTIVVSNAGPENAAGTMVTDNFPAALTGIGWSAVLAGGATANNLAGGGNINETVNLPAGASITYTVTATISPAATGALSNAATVTVPAGMTDIDTANNSRTDDTVLTPQADLAVTVTDNQTTDVAGTTIAYTIVVSNAGPSNAPGSTVTDNFPASLTGITWSAAFAGGATGNASGTGTISQTVSLPAGSSITYTVNATISPGATGTLSNTASVAVAAGVADSILTNNSRIDDTTLTRQADLSISKTDGQTSDVAGTSIPYTIVVSNAGPSNAPGSTVTDNFPASLTGVTWTAVFTGGATGAASGAGNISQTVNLPAGSSITYTATATIAPNALGTLTNVATAAAAAGIVDAPGNNSATDTTLIDSPSADLTGTITDNQASDVPGTTITYTIIVGNAGPATATQTTVGLSLPVGLSNVSWTAAFAGGATGNANGNGAIGERVNLPAGSSITYTLNAVINATALGILDSTVLVTAPAGIVDPTPNNNFATDTTTLTRQAALSISKTDNQTSDTPGTTIAYTIVVRNDGPSHAANTMVTDNLPLPLSGAPWSAAFTGGATGNATGFGHIREIVSLPPGSRATYTLNALIPAGASGLVTNTATVAASVGIADDPADNSATDTTLISNQPVLPASLSITKNDGQASDIPGTQIVYTIAVRNDGPGSAPATTVTDVLPAALFAASWRALFTGGARSRRPDGASGVGNINEVIDLPPGAGATYVVSATISATATGMLSNTATVVAGPGVDDVAGANIATDDTMLTPLAIGNADLGVTVDATPRIVQSGELISYSIVVTNHSLQAAGGVRLTDTLPPNVAFDSIEFAASNPSPGRFTRTGQTVNIDLGTLPARSTARARVRVVAVDSEIGPATTRVDVAHAGMDNVAGNNQATATTTITVPQAELSVQMSGPDDVELGQDVTYTITVRNDGRDKASAVKLIDTLPAGVTDVSATTSQGAVTISPGSVIVDIGTLNPKATARIQVRVRPAAEGRYENRARVESALPDATPGNNAASVLTRVFARANVGIIVNDSADPIRPPGEFGYTLFVFNDGPQTATNVVVTDTLPLGTTFLAASTPSQGGFSVANGVVTWNVGTLANGANASLVITHMVPVFPSPRTLSNIATVRADQLDLVPANNRDVETTDVQIGPDLVITQTAAPTVTFVERDIEVRLTVTNTGNVAAINPVINNPLPSTVRFIAPVLGANAVTYLGGLVPTVRAAIGTTAPGSLVRTLAPGASQTISFLIRPTVAGTIRNQPTVASVQAVDLNPADNAAPRADITVHPPTADLQVLLVSTFLRPGIAEYIRQTITVRNNGPFPATNVALQYGVEALNSTRGVQFLTAQPPTGIGTLNPGQSRVIEVELLPGDLNRDITLRTQISARANQRDDQPGNNSVDRTTSIRSIEPLIMVGLNSDSQALFRVFRFPDMIPIYQELGRTGPDGITPLPLAATEPIRVALGEEPFSSSSSQRSVPDLYFFTRRFSTSKDGRFASNVSPLQGGGFVAPGNFVGLPGEADSAIGPDVGNRPDIRFRDTTAILSAYPPEFQGGVRVAAGDIDGDGLDELITVPGPTFGTSVQPIRVFRIVHFDPRRAEPVAELIREFHIGSSSSEPRQLEGYYVAAGDVSGDGRDDIIVSGGEFSQSYQLGKVFYIDATQDATQMRPKTVFFDPYSTTSGEFQGGIRVAAADLNGDGFAEIITGSGPGTVFFPGENGRPGGSTSSAQITVYDGAALRAEYVRTGTVSSEFRSPPILRHTLDGVLTGIHIAAWPPVTPRNAPQGAASARSAAASWQPIDEDSRAAASEASFNLTAANAEPPHPDRFTVEESNQPRDTTDEPVRRGRRPVLPRSTTDLLASAIDSILADELFR